MVADERYWVAVLRRDELLDVLQRRGVQRLSPIRDLADITLAPGKIVALWRSAAETDRPLLPQIIVGQSHDLEDLCAWAFSYLRGLGPLTAQTRVLTLDEYHSALKRKHRIGWWDAAGGFVGMVVAEAIVQTIPVQGQRGEDIGLVPCRSTLSFIFARAAALGIESEDLRHLGLIWEQLRIQTGQPATTVAADEVTSVAASLQSATLDRPTYASSGPRVSGWLRQFFQQRNATELLEELSSSIVGAHKNELKNLLKGTAEGRVQFFDQVLPTLIDQSPFDRAEKAFVIALAAFLSRPGFSHQLSLLHPTMRTFPDAPLWLGAMQALYSPEETLAYGEGLGWRLARDAFQQEDVFSTPRHDISYTELRLLLRNKSLSRSIRFLPKSRLDVELSPGLSTWIRSLLYERPEQDELPMNVRQSERDAAELSAKNIRVAERSLEAALSIIRRIPLADDPSRRAPRRKGR